DGVERLGRAESQPASFLRDDRADRSGSQCRIQDVPLVPVQSDRIANGLAVAATSHDHRRLSSKIDPGLGDAGRTAQVLPGAPKLRTVVYQDLPFAVVARVGRLEDERQPNLCESAFQLALSAHGMPRRVRYVLLRQKAFLPQPVLSRPESSPAGTNEPAARKP